MKKSVRLLLLTWAICMTVFSNNTILHPLLNPTPLVLAQGPEGKSVPNELIYNEQQTVYLTNLKRAEYGLPPMRWNKQLTEAARWFSRDSVENRSGGYCGHGDTNGEGPLERARHFGYYGSAGAENAYCGYVTPQQAVAGWHNSPGHRNNMLNPDFWEVGLGYYRRPDDGRGYVAQGFGHDAAYPPVIINNEAIGTANPAVDLYIHSNAAADPPFTGLGSTVKMMIANDSCDFGTAWEPYSPTRAWTLAAGSGRRTVYVKLRDASGRSVVVSDDIYLGDSIPYQELSLAQASTRADQVNLYELDGGDLPLMQFSQGWVAEMESGHLWWGNGQVANDSEASAGQAFRLDPGAGESFIWFITTDYPRNLSSQAYFRLKVDDNTISTPAIRISVKTNDVERDILTLKGTDFAASGVYQEFPLDFVQHDDPSSSPWLYFRVYRYGEATVYVDRVAVFTAPEPVQAGKTWPALNHNHRGGSIWVRYTDNAGSFSPITEAVTTRSQLQLSATSLNFVGDDTLTIPAVETLTVDYGKGCNRPAWSIQSSRPWLKASANPPHIRVSVDSTGLPVGAHSATLTVDAGTDILNSPQTISVIFNRVDQLKQVFLPIVNRNG